MTVVKLLTFGQEERKIVWVCELRSDIGWWIRTGHVMCRALAKLNSHHICSYKQ